MHRQGLRAAVRDALARLQGARLLRQRRDALQQICRHLGVEPDDAMYGLLGTKVNSSRISSQERPLESGEIAWLRLLCTSDIPELQISEDVPKTSILDLLKSILSLVPWMTRFLLHKFR